MAQLVAKVSTVGLKSNQLPLSAAGAPDAAADQSRQKHRKASDGQSICGVNILMAVAADVAACGSRKVGFGLLFTAGRMDFAGVGVKRGEKRNPAGGRECATSEYEQQCQDRHLPKSFSSGLFSEAGGATSRTLLSGQKKG